MNWKEERLSLLLKLKESQSLYDALKQDRRNWRDRLEIVNGEIFREAEGFGIGDQVLITWAFLTQVDKDAQQLEILPNTHWTEGMVATLKVVNPRLEVGLIERDEVVAAVGWVLLREMRAAYKNSGQ